MFTADGEDFTGAYSAVDKGWSNRAVYCRPPPLMRYTYRVWLWWPGVMVLRERISPSRQWGPEPVGSSRKAGREERARSKAISAKTATFAALLIEDYACRRVEASTRRMNSDYFENAALGRNARGECGQEGFKKHPTGPRASESVSESASERSERASEGWFGGSEETSSTGFVLSLSFPAYFQKDHDENVSNRIYRPRHHGQALVSESLSRPATPLVVYDVVPALADAIGGLARRAGTSCRDAAGRSEVVITMLPDGPEVEQAILGNGRCAGRARRRERLWWT